MNIKPCSDVGLLFFDHIAREQKETIEAFLPYKT
jgi:hypothetical protein